MGWMRTPKPDPAIGRAAEQQAQLSREMADVARQELAFGREQYARFAPLYERLIGVQTGQAEQDARFAADQMGRYRDVFQPVEDRVVNEAMTYDSPEEMARREGLAANTVQGQFDAAREQNVRQQAAMGVSPDSGRGVQGGIDDANALALMKSGAVNTERANTKLMGMQLRQQAAGMGRGVAGQGLQASQIATGAAGAGIGGATTAIGARGAAMQPALQYASGASQTGASAANILNQQYGNRVAAHGSKLGAIGSIAGMGLGMWRSDEKAKKGRMPVGDDEALTALRKVPVESWEYRDGAGPPGRQVGPMAQDVNAVMGERAAPGGTQLDPVSMNGVNMAAIKALDRKVAALTKLVKAGGGAQPIDDARLVGLEPLRM